MSDEQGQKNEGLNVRVTESEENSPRTCQPTQAQALCISATETKSGELRNIDAPPTVTSRPAQSFPSTEFKNSNSDNTAVSSVQKKSKNTSGHKSNINFPTQSPPSQPLNKPKGDVKQKTQTVRSYDDELLDVRGINQHGQKTPTARQHYLLFTSNAHTQQSKTGKPPDNSQLDQEQQRSPNFTNYTHMHHSETREPHDDLQLYQEQQQSPNFTNYTHMHHSETREPHDDLQLYPEQQQSPNFTNYTHMHHSETREPHDDLQLYPEQQQSPNFTNYTHMHHSETREPHDDLQLYPEQQQSTHLYFSETCQPFDDSQLGWEQHQSQDIATFAHLQICAPATSLEEPVLPLCFQFISLENGGLPRFSNLIVIYNEQNLPHPNLM
ncbi:signal transducer and activator of transcription C-like [Mya arenaria]|uniref:signal transducer and activator of transcription C-like n=1 Tax=Mya arenaria TaxID=6604 RepID=UPI0022E614A0|nr:signal transducer and activator of transcription C-like [Mya arenaria]